MLIKRRLLGVSIKVIFQWKVHTLPLFMEFNNSHMPPSALLQEPIPAFLGPSFPPFFHTYRTNHTKRSVYVNVVISHESHVCFQFTYSAYFTH
jgi:hypothetical protein